MALSPSWAFSGQAVDAVGDAHLAPGVHYRVLTNPLLGLPVVPLVIGKITLGQMAKGHTRFDVTWVDSHGTVLTAPFAVTPDNPVTGYLPLGQTCCWAALEGRASGALPPLGQLPGRVATRGVREPADPASDDVRRMVVQPAERAFAGASHVPLPAAFSLEGVVATPLGDAPVAIRSRAPYHVYASHIERVVVRGSGTVTGFSWLPASAVDVFERFRTAPLPTGPGARYLGPVDGADEGFKRVERGAPQRFGMHESPLAAAPIGCAVAGVPDELDRVSLLTGEPAISLDRLINDTSLPQRLLTQAETVFDENGNSLGTSTRFVLMDILQGGVDPGIARWLGFLDVDETLAPKDVVVAYIVDALFAPDWKALDRQRLGLTLAGSVFDDGAKALQQMAQHAPELLEYQNLISAIRGPFLQLRVVLAATAGEPLDVPSAPALGVPVTGDWLPAPAPTAIRETTVDLERLVPGAGLASAIAQPAAGTPVERNPEQPPTRRLLLTARPDDAATTATSGVLADRLADERDGTWQIAQLDWFGRWSGWARQTIAAATRPRPPRPVFTLTTLPPSVPTPTPTGPLAGKVRVEISVPPVEGLPAGGRLLDELVLTATTSGGGSVVSSHPLATPSAPPEVMVVQVDGPALLPTEQGTVTVTAVWLDSDGVSSDVSEPKTAAFSDPRPPVPVVIPPTLTYTARPDATGRARATLSWTPSAGQASYRVFFADETTLRAKLHDVATGVIAPGDAGQAPTASQAQTILTALDAAGDDAPARGAIWDANRTLLPRRWWLLVTAVPIAAPTSGAAVFTHDVSGSLTVLALYRVVAVSAASVESDFRTSPLLPRGVPNLLVPPVPALAVLPVVDGAGNLQAQLTITVPVGPTPAVRYRLRRATATSDAGLMQVVAEGPVGPRPAGDPAPQVATMVDTGTSPSGPRTSLSAWLRYTWRVEVQGAPAPGGGPVGEWSSVSAPTQTTIMPPDPPVGVENVTATRDAAGVHVQFTHPDPLAAGGSGGYTVDVYRQLAGASLRLLQSLPGQAPPPTGRGDNVLGTFDVVDGDAEAVAGTLYRVVVTDPIGRSSAPSDPVAAP